MVDIFEIYSYGVFGYIAVAIIMAALIAGAGFIALTVLDWIME